jgi:hypothetical protein
MSAEPSIICRGGSHVGHDLAKVWLEIGGIQLPELDNQGTISYDRKRRLRTYIDTLLDSLGGGQSDSDIRPLAAIR